MPKINIKCIKHLIETMQSLSFDATLEIQGSHNYPLLSSYNTSEIRYHAHLLSPVYFSLKDDLTEIIDLTITGHRLADFFETQTDEEIDRERFWELMDISPIHEVRGVTTFNNKHSLPVRLNVLTDAKTVTRDSWLYR